MANEKETYSSGIETRREIGEMPDGMTRLNAPAFYTSSLQIVSTSTDLMIVFGRPHPLLSRGAGDKQEFSMGIEAQAIVHMSPQTAKDLSLLLAQQVSDMEKVFGPIETPMTLANKGERQQ